MKRGNSTLSTIVFGLFLALSGQAVAGELPYEHLFTEVSQPGESRDDFAARIAPQLRAYSDETGFEACGVIATDGERFGAVIGTSKSHIGCANYHGKVPEGMRSDNVTIHSHGGDRSFGVNKADRRFLGERLPSHVRSIHGQVLDQFSALDYAEPGSLATPSGIIYQDGRVSGL